MSDEIVRWAVVPNERTPAHLAAVMIFTEHDRASKYAEDTRGTVMSALDTDAMALEERKHARG